MSRVVSSVALFLHLDEEWASLIVNDVSLYPSITDHLMYIQVFPIRSAGFRRREFSSLPKEQTHHSELVSLSSE